MSTRTDARPAALEQVGEETWLRFSRAMPHAPETVWEAVTDPAVLAAWFPQGVEYLSWDGEPAAGAGVRYTMPTGDTFSGEVLLCEAPSLLRVRWGPDVLRFGLEPDGDSSATTLTVVIALDSPGKAARDAAAWHVCLDALADVLDAGLDRLPAADTPALRVGMTDAQKREWQQRYLEYTRIFAQ